MVSGFQLWLAAFRGKRGGIVSLKCVAKTKVTPIKTYNASFFNGAGTAFQDVTGLTLTVPNNSYYSMRGSLVSAVAASTTTLQILQGASVVFTDSVIFSTKATDSGILKNISGSSQTVKVQIKNDSGTATSGRTSTMSLITALNILPFDASGYANEDIWADITSLDFVGCCGNGLSNVYYDSDLINDTVTTPVTWNKQEKFVNLIRFWGAVNGYVGFDWTGNEMISSCV